MAEGRTCQSLVCGARRQAPHGEELAACSRAIRATGLMQINDLRPSTLPRHAGMMPQPAEAEDFPERTERHGSDLGCRLS